jgi:hypothetical protein
MSISQFFSPRFVFRDHGYMRFNFIEIERDSGPDISVFGWDAYHSVIKR